LADVRKEREAWLCHVLLQKTSYPHPEEKQDHERREYDDHADGAFGR
jgi:hypothetical protein